MKLTLDVAELAGLAVLSWDGAVVRFRGSN